MPPDLVLVAGYAKKPSCPVRALRGYLERIKELMGVEGTQCFPPLRSEREIHKRTILTSHDLSLTHVLGVSPLKIVIRSYVEGHKKRALVRPICHWGLVIPAPDGHPRFSLSTFCVYKC